MLYLSAFMVLFTVVLVEAGESNRQPELGSVHWSRDLDAALAQAAREDKPVFLLFQEVPGCSTCTGFGRDVLSHPLLVAAIEESFVPVVVRNNAAGREAEILKRYDEPAWNNPVVRFVSADGKDLIAREDGVWDAHGIAVRMIAALEASDANIPGYLKVARDESDPSTQTALFAMHCFWEGEASLGAIEGVVSSKAGFGEGGEVVAVTFLPAVVTKSDLATAAARSGCRVTGSDRFRAAPASDQQHSLAGTTYAKLDLTPMQRTKIHSALMTGGDPQQWLTPAQRADK